MLPMFMELFPKLWDTVTIKEFRNELVFNIFYDKNRCCKLHLQYNWHIALLKGFSNLFVRRGLKFQRDGEGKREFEFKKGGKLEGRWIGIGGRKEENMKRVVNRSLDLKRA
jgi:hypothetical protein